MAQPEEEKTWEEYLAAAIKAFRKEMRQACGEIWPAEFHTHRRAAQREILLALRALLDAKIERLEKAEQATPKATPIPVE